VKNLKSLRREQWLSLVLIGLIGGGVPFVLFFRGLQLTNGPIGSFIHKTMFIYVAILAMLFLKEKLSKKIIIPAALLLLGNLLLLNLASFSFNSGILLIFMATLFWSVENIISKHLLKSIEPKVLAFGRLFFGSLFILTYLAATNRLTYFTQITLAQFTWILISVPFLLLYVMTWYTGLKLIKASTATAILLLGSPITTLLSFVFLNTSLSIMQAAGILMIAAGVISSIFVLEKRAYATTSTA
jgi:drug/metabolite transporter (DMT)-like permease